MIQRALQELDVGTEAPDNRIPRSAVPRIGRKDDDAVFVGSVEQKAEARCAAAGAVQHHRQRRGGLGAITARNEQQPVAARTQAECMRPRFDRGDGWMRSPAHETAAFARRSDGRRARDAALRGRRQKSPARHH